MRHVLLSLLPCVLFAQAPSEPAHIQVFQATASAVRKGGAVTLRWAVTGVERVRLEPLGQDLPARGEITQPINGRTIFWLHATNSSGGQSLPLVVELLPDDPAFPNLNGLHPPAILEPPRVPALAEPPKTPAVAESPKAPVFELTPTPVLAALPKRRVVRRSRQAWIQFAAMINLRCTRKLQGNLLRVAGTESSLWSRARHSGPPMQFIRCGPFPSPQAAQDRLRELLPRMASLQLQPIVITHGPRALAPSTIYVASLR